MAAGARADFETAIGKLCSLQDGDRGVIEVVAWGQEMVPRLRELLFQREPSGLFETRCRVVAALAALKADEVLIEFLSAGRFAADPIERLGDDAVANTAARALGKADGSDYLFRLLLRLGQTSPYLAGVIEALGSFDRAEAIPVLVKGLDDDGSRLTAEAALLRLGRVSLPMLLETANSRQPSASHESDGSRRRRRSALKLIAEIGIEELSWPKLRELTEDPDARISFLACDICLSLTSGEERSAAIRRLARLMPDADWMLREDIRGCLRCHSASAGENAQTSTADTSTPRPFT